MNRILKLFLLLLTISIVASCSKSSKNSEFDYVAIKLAGSEMWSIMDIKTGEILLKDEFKNQPSIIYNDVFLVENDNGTYDYYNVNDVTKPINSKPYYMAADFDKTDVTPAALPGKQITLINTKCEEVAVLDKSITACGHFSEGLAAYIDESEKCGYIDTKGNIVIKAKYDVANMFNDGIAICLTYDTKNDKIIFYAVDKNGKELFSFTSKDYQSVGIFNEGYLPVIKGDEIIYLDKTGKKAYSLCNVTDEDYQLVNICIHKNGRSVFAENGLYGLKDSKNNIMLRAKYNMLIGMPNGMYIATKNGKSGIIDTEDNTVIDFKYDGITRFRNNVFAVNDGETWTLIDDKGKDATTVNFTEYSLSTINIVKSNYINPKDYAQRIINNFTSNSFSGYTGDFTLENFKNELIGSESNYLHDVCLTINNSGSQRPVTVCFDNIISSKTYRTEDNGYWSYQVPTGYKFNYDAKLIIATKQFDITEFDSYEAQIDKEFEKALTAKGYKRQSDGYMKSPSGTYVGLNYNEGIINVTYYFKDMERMSLDKNARERKIKETPQGVDKE